MADQSPGAGPDSAEKKKSKMVPLVVLLVTGVSGYFAGTAVLAPRLLADGDTETETHAAEPEPAHGAPPTEDTGHGPRPKPPADDGHGGSSSDDGHGGPPEGESHFVEVGNILVNPRDSRGLRFLMATIAFELEDSDTRSILRQREAQVRDVVISVLEQLTMEELTEPGSRDSIRAQLRSAVMAEFELPYLQVFISQFLIN